ncbi:phage portal protein, pbsx family, partial [Escherichia coli TW00353]
SLCPTGESRRHQNYPAQ